MESFTTVDFTDLSCLYQYVDKTKINNIVSIKTADYINLIDNMNWKALSSHRYLSEKLMFQFQTYLSWIEIFTCQRLSHEFMRNQLGKIYRYKEIVSKFQILTEEAMTEFAELLDWNLLSQYQNMSEEFIEKNVQRVNWNVILKRQRLSKKFLDKHKHRAKIDLSDEEGYDEVDSFFLMEGGKREEFEKGRSLKKNIKGKCDCLMEAYQSTFKHGSP